MKQELRRPEAGPQAALEADRLFAGDSDMARRMRQFGLTPVWWTGEYYRSSYLMWILLVLASTFVRAPCGARTLVPAHASDTPARAGPVKIGRRAYMIIRRDISRPHLDGPEHDGSVVAELFEVP